MELGTGTLELSGTGHWNSGMGRGLPGYRLSLEPLSLVGLAQIIMASRSY